MRALITSTATAALDRHHPCPTITPCNPRFPQTPFSPTRGRFLTTIYLSGPDCNLPMPIAMDLQPDQLVNDFSKDFVILTAPHQHPN